MEIPIRNLYYLLCYAWNRLEEAEKVQVNKSDYDDAINLFARVLVNGCYRLFKKGLDRNYISVSEEYIGVKGKVDFASSIRKNLFKQAKAACVYDQFEYDILENQILKTVLKRLIKVKTINPEYKDQIMDCYYRFHQVHEIELHLNHFSKIRINRNNLFYDFLLKVAFLIVLNTSLDEEDGSYTFVDFRRNETQMRYLFEDFVRNFFKKEQSEYKVRRENIAWEAMPIGNSDASLLPRMQTDISLEKYDHKIVIDTKYKQKTLAFHYSDKFHSENLYQIYSYLRNLEKDKGNPNNSNCEGILLYPTVGKNIEESFQLGSHKLKIATVDLGDHWRSIHERLLSIIGHQV